MTGLRRSGKTVFTTALVHHLLDGHDLPFVKAVHEERFLGARLWRERGPGAFPYHPFEAQLRGSPPAWPEATERLSTLHLEVAYRTASLVLSQVAPIQHLKVEVVDYPGEWLLDLALLGQSFEAFSAHTLALLAAEPRAGVGGEFREALAAFGPEAPADPAAVSRVAAAYTRTLERCQRGLGLSLVQPGRFTNPGDLAGDPVLAFCPLPPGAVRPGTNRALIADRYLDYRERVVRRFYEDEFSRFDRQIVLVDLLSSLNAGPAYFDDTSTALSLVLESFRYGDPGFLGRLFAPRIDKLLFAASKADHVAHNQHGNLKQLLELMVTPAARSARRAGIAVEVLALAALRSTDVVRTEHHGQQLSCVRGRLKDEARETVLFPGEIPPSLPQHEDWASGRFRFRDFAPRRLVPGQPGQHIRLDQALEFLLGDKLR